MPRSLITLLLLTIVTAAQGQDSLIVKSVYFGGGSYFVEYDQAIELKEFIQNVENLENYEIIIFGHTDDIGGREYNEWLSRMRSQSVYMELIELQVPKELMEIKSFGYNNPLYTNRTQSGRVMNRRVDVILAPVVF